MLDGSEAISGRVSATPRSATPARAPTAAASAIAEGRRKTNSLRQTRVAGTGANGGAERISSTAAVGSGAQTRRNLISVR